MRVVEISEMFRVTAKAVIFVNGKVLLLRKPTGKWDLPGGRLGNDEDIKICLAREIAEEIGLDVNVGTLIDCNLRRLQEPKFNVIIVAHLCTLNGTFSDIVLSSEHTEVRLFSDHEIDSLDMRSAYHKPVRKAFIQRKAAPGDHETPHRNKFYRDVRSVFQILKARLFSS